MEKSKAEDTVHEHGGRLHDSEDVSRRGMSSDAAAADEAETMASTGDSENAFREIAAGEDLDEVAEGDYWRQNFRRRPYYQAGTPYEHYEPGFRYGWQSAIDEQYSGRDFRDVESELERSWDALNGENAQEWEEARQPVRDAWMRARGQSDE